MACRGPWSYKELDTTEQLNNNFYRAGPVLLEFRVREKSNRACCGNFRKVHDISGDELGFVLRPEEAICH